MQTQCPQCYSYEVNVAKPKNFWIWLLPMAVVDMGIVIIIVFGKLENPVPLLIGLVVADMLLTVPLMRAIMSRKNFPSGALYRCMSCGHQWTEAGPINVSEDAPTSLPEMPSMIPNNTSFQMTIQDVFSIKGRGTVVTGQVAYGAISVGEAIELHHAGTIIQAVVDGIEKFRRTQDRAEAGDNVGILLRNVGKDDVARGDVLKGG